MIHPGTSVVKISPEVGLGVVASTAIARGTIVWIQDRFDQVIARAEAEALDDAHRAIVDRYAHLDAEGNRILCWDGGRLVNHACEPTLRGIGPTFMVARWDIQPGEQITCDYAECNLTESLDCCCGSDACRGMIHGHDLATLGPSWDAEARELIVDARRVAQPLIPYAFHRDQLERLLAGDAPIPSFASQCAFLPNTNRELQ